MTNPIDEVATARLHRARRWITRTTGSSAKAISAPRPSAVSAHDAVWKIASNAIADNTPAATSATIVASERNTPERPVIATYDSSMATASQEPSGTQIVASWRLVAMVAAGIIGVIVVRSVFVDAHRVLGWAVAASVVAMLLDPVIDGVDRFLPRAVAVVATFVAIIAIGVGIATLYSTTLRAQTDRLVEAAPNIAADIESRDDRLGELAQTFQFVDRVEDLMTRLDDSVGTGSDTIRSAALAAPAYFVSMILTIFLLVFGHRVVTGGLAQLSLARRARLTPALASATRRTQRYVWSALAQSAAVGCTIAMLAFWLSAPAPVLIGLFAALASLIPYLGVLIGSLPLLLLGLGVAEVWQVGVAALVVGALIVVEAAWWQPRIHRTSLYVGPAIPLIVAVVGSAVYGIGGALYSMALAVFALALFDEFDADPADLPTPLDDFDGDDRSAEVGDAAPSREAERGSHA